MAEQSRGTSRALWGPAFSLTASGLPFHRQPMGTWSVNHQGPWHRAGLEAPILLHSRGQRTVAPSHLLSWFLCLGQSQARLTASDSRAEAVDRAIPAEAAPSVPTTPEGQRSWVKALRKANPLGGASSPCLPPPRAWALLSLSKHCRWPLGGTLGRLPYTGLKYPSRCAQQRHSGRSRSKRAGS